MVTSMPRLPSLLRLPSRLRLRRRRNRMATLVLLVAVMCLFAAPFYIIYKPPGVMISYFEYRWPEVLWRIRTKEKIVGLTIDDAPSEHTAEIMNVLRTNEAKATFFVIGSQTKGRENVLEDLVLHEHELGNHAMHDEPSRSLSDEALEKQLLAVRERINKAYASAKVENPRGYFRPGSGFFSTRMLAVVERLKFKLVLGSIYPHDAQINSPSINSRHILSMVQPGGIIICHDRRSWTVPMLKVVLPELKRRGYRIVTITELLQAADL